MVHNALKTYQAVENTTLSGRELEASILSRSAMRLAAVRDNWGAADREEQLDEALRYNQRLWTLFQTELTDPNNPLPIELKRNLLSLSAFIDKRTFEVLSDPEPAKLDILIEINRNIAAGLRSH
jgi:flagellar protein FlaF